MGQYGSIAFETVSSSSGSVSKIIDDTSVFNEENLLFSYNSTLNSGQGGIQYDKNHWRHPYGGVYKNAVGEASKLELAKISTTEYNPAVPSEHFDKVETVGSGANTTYWIAPQYLSNVKDFLDNWQESWAEALVPYHPEYPYLAFEKYLR